MWEARPRSSAGVASTVNPGVFSPLLSTFLHKEGFGSFGAEFSFVAVARTWGGDTREDTFVLAHGFRALVHG